MIFGLFSKSYSNAPRLRSKLKFQTDFNARLKKLEKRVNEMEMGKATAGNLNFDEMAHWEKIKNK